MKSKFYTYESGTNTGIAESESLSFYILVHGMDEDIYGHRFNNTTGANTWFMYDPKKPFVLIPYDLMLEAVTVCGGDLVSVSPAFGDFDPSIVEDCNEGINRSLTETYKMLLEFDVAHKMYGSGDRVSMVPADNKKDPIRKTYDVTWDDKDTELKIATKSASLTKALDDMHSHLRPVKTVFGTCYECDAIMVNGWPSAINSRLYTMTEEKIDANARRLFGLALHRYPQLWDTFARGNTDIITKHADEIFHRDVTSDEVDSNYIAGDIRIVLKDAITKCLKDSTNFVDRVKEFVNLVDNIDDDELCTLARKDYKDSLRQIEDKIIATDPSITPDIMKKRIDPQIEAYRSGGLREVFPDDDYYYDD